MRVENLLCGKGGIGTPDVNISTGWVELKWAKSWPSRPSTPLRLPHFTDEQRNWALRRKGAGGRCWLVLQVKQEWFIFDEAGMQWVGTWTRQELIDNALVYFPTKPTSEQLCAVFRRPA